MADFKPNLTWDEEAELTDLSIEHKEHGSEYEEISEIIGNSEKIECKNKNVKNLRRKISRNRTFAQKSKFA